MSDEKLTPEEMQELFLKQFKEEVGNVYKDHETGIYFKTAGNGKLHTSLKIHTDAGGDAELFKAWSDAQDNPH